MKKILLVGSGAREHVIAETLKRSKEDVSIIAYGRSKNPGILKLATRYELGPVDKFEDLKKLAVEEKPDFAFIGPDNPIADGAADALLDLEIHSVAPLQTVARLESSKSFTRDLLAKYNIPGNPKFKVFFDEDNIREFIENDLGGEYVVKADGLMGGKGVKVSGEHLASIEEGVKYAADCLHKTGRVVIEEKFVGQEFSLMCFCDGENIAPMPAVQDHKRAFDGDKGPNTGGMGSYSDASHSLPFLKPGDIDAAIDITKQTTLALFEETGVLFKGIMYGGFIVTKNGVKLIEYNARFGDPEVMNVLPILKTDFVEICEAIIKGNLNKLKVEFENKATVCKYIVPEGYPENPVKGAKIEVGNVPEGVKMYYSSVDQKEGGIYMSSSRAVAFVGIADTIHEAEKSAAGALASISGPVFYRTDIGTDALIQQRIEMMKKIRS
ncbi:phosphoribosylamine--glycine ligase [Candidatus Peregrinibacteria bacterium]|nr:phosphoribosylamine--glycine ligase [Candidatus Peregrinibacteria bacterium]